MRYDMGHIRRLNAPRNKFLVIVSKINIQPEFLNEFKLLELLLTKISLIVITNNSYDAKRRISGHKEPMIKRI